MAPVDGFWGKPTATIDWCEENYRVTPYIAEFWNTISNLTFIIPPIITLLIAIRESHENRYKMCHIGVVSVGFGSWLFHMTLLYSMQLLDELPMIIGAAFLLYSHIEVASPENHHNRPLQVALTLYSAIVVSFYLFSKQVVFFQVSYGIMVASMILSASRIFLYHKYSLPLFLSSFVTYMGGFCLWLIDQNYCGHLKILRSDILGILGPLAELHAWWHILAGTGTYLSVLFSAHTRYLYLNKNPQIKFWMGLWPYLTLPSANIKKID